MSRLGHQCGRLVPKGLPLSVRALSSVLPGIQTHVLLIRSICKALLLKGYLAGLDCLSFDRLLYRGRKTNFVICQDFGSRHKLLLYGYITFIDSPTTGTDEF
jgi:hypothetical protein